MDTHERYLVFHRMRKEHSVNLTEEQVDTIDKIYLNKQAEMKGDLVGYRLVNFCLSIIMFLLFVFVRKDVFSYWMAIGLTSFFGFVNLFYMFLNVYRLVKFKDKHEIKE